MGNSSSRVAEQVGNAIQTAFSPVVAALVGLFTKRPEVSNDTMRQIQASNEQLTEQRRHLEEAEARAEERVREAEAREAAFREQAQAELSAADEARRWELAAAKSREEAALAKAREANSALQQGIRPIVMPSQAQVQAAMERVQYDPEKLHFAVCGTSGSGKSSLINAFRGLGLRGAGAAAVGVTETTSKITRYPDPRSEVPYSRFVWYDIPGAGTTAVSDWQYFNDQGLFVFDFIIMVYDVRFTKIDVGIMENCYRFNIPVFIVRSKADQHIDNMMKVEEIDSTPGDADYEDIYQETKSRYVEATKADFDNHMEKLAEALEVDARDRQMILHQRVYVVSSANVRGLLQSGAKKGTGVNKRLRIIDEVLLVEDMLRTAARRRYSKPEEALLEARGEGLVQERQGGNLSELFFGLEIGTRSA
jgi:GTP-binding protein EngB required for normal cell division